MGVHLVVKALITFFIFIFCTNSVLSQTSVGEEITSSELFQSLSPEDQESLRRAIEIQERNLQEVQNELEDLNADITEVSSKASQLNGVAKAFGAVVGDYAANSGACNDDQARLFDKMAEPKITNRVVARYRRALDRCLRNQMELASEIAYMRVRLQEASSQIDGINKEIAEFDELLRVLGEEQSEVIARLKWLNDQLVGSDVQEILSNE